MKKKFVILTSLLILVLGVGYFINRRFYENSRTQLPTGVFSTAPVTSSSTVTPTPEPVPTPLPNSYLIKNFPFQSQAPYANWDELHDEACEEASLILVKYFLLGKDISAEEMEEQIQKMVAWEIDNFGSHRDLTIAETAQMAKGFYNLSSFKIYDDINIEDIKREVSQNHPVIVPSAGRLLGNPNFRQPGPIYHMVVVIGYEGNMIIVQDVGTRRGDHYEYNEKIFYNAIHDWNGTPENIENGKKTMLVFE